MPMRTFSPMIDNTDTSMSSPIMMLWFDFRVRTSTGNLPAPGGEPTVTAARRDPQPRFARSVLLGGKPAHSYRLRHRHGTTFPAPAAQQDPRLGPPGPHRRVDRPPARGDRPADPGLQ